MVFAHLGSWTGTHSLGPSGETEASAAFSREQEGQAWPFPRTLAKHPALNLGRIHLPLGPCLSTGGKKPGEKKQGPGTQVIVNGAQAPIIANALGKMQSHCGTTNLDAKPFLSAPEGRGGKPHSKQEEGKSIPNALCSWNENLSPSPSFPVFYDFVNFPPPTPLVSG